MLLCWRCCCCCCCCMSVSETRSGCAGVRERAWDDASDRIFLEGCKPVASVKTPGSNSRFCEFRWCSKKPSADVARDAKNMHAYEKNFFPDGDLPVPLSFWRLCFYSSEKKYNVRDGRRQHSVDNGQPRLERGSSPLACVNFFFANNGKQSRPANSKRCVSVYFFSASAYNK